MEQFKLKKVALAVSSAIGALGFAGMADAASVGAAVTVTAPKIAGTFTAATAAGKKLRIVGTNTGTVANMAGLTLKVVSTATNSFATPLATVTDTDAGTGSFDLTVAAAIASTNPVVAVLQLTGGPDGTNAFDAGTTNVFAVVKSDGTLVNLSTDGQAAVDAAVAASNTIAVNATYTGPVITAASQASATGAITLSFNAALSGDSTNASATIGGSTAGVTGVGVLSVINGALTNNQAVFGTGTNAVSAGATAATVSVASTASGFSVGVNRAQLSGTVAMWDQAGNRAITQTVATNFTGGKPATLNGTAGVNAVVTALDSNAGANDITEAWTTAGSTVGAAGVATITIQMKERVAYTGTATGITVTPAAFAGNHAVTANADGSVDVDLDLTAAGVTAVGFDANGQLQVKAGTSTTWSPVAVSMDFTSTTEFWSVATTQTAMAGTSDSIAAMNAMAGLVPAPTILTLDGNTDGYIEGLTVNANGPTFAATDASVSLLNVVSGTATFASTQSLQTGNGKLDIKLSNALNTYDWNQDGTVGNTGDAVSLARFGTGAVASGTNALGFSLQTAGGTSGGSATYGNAYRTYDGAKRPVQNSDTTANLTSFTDNANPVLVGTVYAQTDAGGASTPSGTRVPSGTVTLTFSEPLDVDSPIFGNSTTTAGSIGSAAGLSEILFNGKPATLVNLDANIAKQLDATHAAGVDPVTGSAAAAGSAVVLNNMPNVTGQAVSISYAGAWQIYDDNAAGGSVTTTGIFPALVSSSTAAFTATEQVDTAIKFTAAALKSTYVAGQKIDTIILDLNKNVARQTGYTDADFNGTFIVRARVGSTRGGAFEQRDATTASDDSFYDFYVAGSNVKVAAESALGGAAKVVLFVPPNTPSNQTLGGIPGDTKALWVDYQPNNTSTGQLVNATSSSSAVNNPEATRFGGVAVTAASGTAITTDDDTLSVTFSPIRLANFASVANTGQLLTQAVIGTAKSGGNALPDNAGVRVDLVSLTTPQAATSGSYRDAVIGDGRVELQRGPNSESSDLQTVALKNLGFDIKYMQAYYAALQAYNAAVIAKDKVKLPAAANLLNMQFGVPSGTGAGFADGSTSTASTLTTAQATAVPAFVQVTTGAGALASAGTNGANGDNSRGNYSGVGEAYSQNANAEFGRTATLVRTPAAIEKNGFTSYPVTINLANGAITALGSNNAINAGAGAGGSLNLNAGSIPVPSTSAGARRFKILDSAYGLVKNGKYNMMVGVPEKDFDAKLVGLEPNVDAAPNTFVLVSARNTSTGKWTLITPADPTFTGGVTGTAVATAPRFLPFKPDLKSNGMPTKVDFDLGLINGVTVKDQASWQLIGMPGVMLRDATKPLTPRFFMTVKQGDGEPVSFWENDDSSKDEAFTLGGGAVANEVKIMAEVGAATVNTGVNPKPAAGLAFNKNAAGKAVADTTANVAVTDTLVGGTESGTADVMDTALGATNDLMLFYPVKGNTTTGAADPATGTLAKGSWHLVTVTGTGRTFGDLSTKGVDAAIVIDTTGGSAKTWFANETTDLNTTAVAKGTALFVHTTAGAGTATFDY